MHQIPQNYVAWKSSTWGKLWALGVGIKGYIDASKQSQVVAAKHLPNCRALGLSKGARSGI
jgi:hypothetical protein